MKRRGLKVKTGIKAPALAVGRGERVQAGIPGVASGMAMAAMTEVQDAIYENRPTFPAPELPPLTFAARKAAAGLTSGLAMLAFPAGQLPQTPAGRVAWVADMLGGRPIVDDEGRPTGETSGPLITKEQAAKLLDIPALDLATTEAFGRMEEEQRPTYATHTHLDPTSPLAFDIWKATTIAGATWSPEGVPSISEPMPPIRCVVSPPCGVCAYCKLAAGGPKWWLA